MNEQAGSSPPVFLCRGASKTGLWWAKNRRKEIRDGFRFKEIRTSLQLLLRQLYLLHHKIVIPVLFERESRFLLNGCPTSTFGHDIYLIAGLIISSSVFSSKQIPVRDCPDIFPDLCYLAAFVYNDSKFSLPHSPPPGTTPV